MKKFLFLTVMAAFLVIYSNAQISIPKVDASAAAKVATSFIKPPAIGDINKTTSAIVDQLTGKLTLPLTQKPLLTQAISGFLTNKNTILALANTDPKQYLAKFNPLQSGLFSKFQGIMGAAKFASFLKLKPTGNIAGNVLSNLFF
jgi:hypothetical protein